MTTRHEARGAVSLRMRVYNRIPHIAELGLGFNADALSPDAHRNGYRAATSPPNRYHQTIPRMIAHGDLRMKIALPRLMSVIGTAALLTTVTSSAFGQIGRNVKIEATNVSDNVYMLTGQGGNMGLSIGDDGAFLIDDQFAPLTGQILETIGELTKEPVKFVVNTHWHGDHTGGNENFGDAGAIIIAHDQVRAQMSVEHFMEAFNRRVEASPPGALPTVTFSDTLTMHWNGDEIHIEHLAPAHTDGDSFIVFRAANVIHMGDTFFNGMYPYIDTATGGNIDGLIDAAARVLELTNENTKIIPGHGPLSTAKDLRAYRDMLKTARDAIAALVEQGMSKEDIVAAKPTAALDAAWGGGFMQPDVWVGIVVDGMTDEDEG